MTKCWQTCCTQVPPFPAKSKSIYFRLCDTANHRYSAVLKLSWFQQTFRILEETKHRAGLLYCSKCQLLYFSEIYIVTNKNLSPVIWESNYPNQRHRGNSASFAVSNNKICMKNRVRSNQVKQKITCFQILLSITAKLSTVLPSKQLSLSTPRQYLEARDKNNIIRSGCKKPQFWMKTPFKKEDA